jgi:ribosomal protein L35AE/L33A
MKAKILSHRRGINLQHNTQYLIKIEDEKYNTKKAAAEVIGKKVIYNTGKGKTISGKITKLHGNKGVVIVTFEKGLPGTAISETVEVK